MKGIKLFDTQANRHDYLKSEVGVFNHDRSLCAMHLKIKLFVQRTREQVL